jgi:hypothetical protein
MSPGAKLMTLYSSKKLKQIKSSLLLDAFLEEFPMWCLLLPKLTPRQQSIVLLRFGLKRFDGTWLNLGDRKEKSQVIILGFTEIGEHLGITARCCYHTYVRGFDNLKRAKKEFSSPLFPRLTPKNCDAAPLNCTSVF